MTEEELARERMAEVERQLHMPLPAAVHRNILCPYCGCLNLAVTRKLCCDLLRKAVIAILSADRLERNAKIAERAMQN